MSTNFDSIRKKRTVSAIVNSVTVAAASFGIVFGVLMLISKLSESSILFALQLAVPIAVGIVAGAITALLTFKSATKIAKEIDASNSLSERIQTMLQFQDDNSDVAKLQREDAERHLSRAKTSKPFFKQFGAAIISAVLAVAIMLPAMLVPHAAENEDDNTTPPPYSEPFTLESWQEERLKKLIETVKAAEIDADFKAATVTELTRLYDTLKKTSTEDAMQAEVISSIILVDAAAEKTASYKLVAVALFSDQTDTAVKDIARSLIKLNGIAFGQDLKKIREYFASDTVTEEEEAEPEDTPDLASEKSSDAEATVVTVTEKLTSLKNEIQRAMDDESIPKNDEIKAHLIAFATEIDACIGEENENTRQSLIEKAFDNLSDKVSTVLSAQYENKAVRDNVINTLMLLFGIEKDMLPKLLGDTVPTLTDGDDTGSGNGESGSVSGGYGEGNELYGSNDTVYDPFGKDGAGHTLYGDVFDDYYRKISELLSDESISEETRQAMVEYFQKLSDGTKK